MEAWLRKLKIHHRLMFGYLLLFLAVLNIAGIALYFLVRSIITENVEAELNRTTSAIVNQIETTAAITIRNHLRGFSQANYQIAEQAYQAFLRGELTEQQARQQAADTLVRQKIGDSGYPYVVDSNGIIQVHPKEALLGADLSKHSFIRRQMEHKQGYLEYDWQNPGESVPRPKALDMIYFAPWDWIISSSSYRDESVRLLNSKDFEASVLSLRFGESGYAYVMNSKGDLIIHPLISGNFYNVTDSNGYEFVKDIIEREDGLTYYTWRNPHEPEYREKLARFTYFPALDWYIIATTYTDEFYQPLAAFTRLVVIMILLSAIIIAVATLALSSSIIRPLLEVMEGVHRAGKKDYSTRLHESHGVHDELGELAHFFNQFMQALQTSAQTLHEKIRERRQAQQQEQELTTQLQHSTEELEQRVQRRSESLKESISRQTEMQDKLVQNKKMASMASLVSGVAGQISPPLVSSLALTSNMRGQSKEISHNLIHNKLQKESLDTFLGNSELTLTTVTDNLNRISTLINQFKLISVDGDYGELSSFHLSDHLSGLAEMLTELPENVTIELDMDPELMLCSWPQIFTTIFSELINNSIIHGFSHNPRTEYKVLITAASDGGRLIIDYRDDGKGVNPDTGHTLFSAFTTGRRHRGNAGLGLHYVYNLVTQKLNGDIEWIEHPGNGFHLRISLPDSAVIPTAVSG